MTITEIKSIIEKQESLGLTRAVLKITKPKGFKQTSEYLRTPFGKCIARYNGTVNGCDEFIVFVPVINMKKYLAKVEANP